MHGRPQGKQRSRSECQKLKKERIRERVVVRKGHNGNHGGATFLSVLLDYLPPDDDL